MTLTPRRKILGALLCLLTPVAVAGPVSCHVTGVSGIDFGSLDAFGSGASVNGRIDYECYNDSGAERRVLLCAAIDGGVGAPTRIAPRTLAPPGGSPLLDYDLYWPDGVTVLGSTPADSLRGFVTIAGKTSLRGSLTMRARLVLPQAGLVAEPGGTLYQRSFAGNSALLSWADHAASAGDPATCSEVPVPFSFTVSARLMPACQISATTLDFGTVFSSQADPIDATSRLTVRCTRGTPHRIALDHGQHAAAGNRHMTGPGGHLLPYTLHQNPARSLAWGNQASDTLQRPTGTGSDETLTVYGRVPTVANAVPGDYVDTVTVTVSY